MKVYYEGSFWGHHGRDHAGKEILIDKHFEWAGRHWLIPAIYSCGKGLVVDFCIRIEPEKIRAFMDKWNLSIQNDDICNFSKEEIAQMELENPMCFDFNTRFVLNGKEVDSCHGYGTGYNPCLPEGEIDSPETKEIMEYYGLDHSCGWVIWRAAFPWTTKKRPVIRTLSVTLEQEMVDIPGPHIHVETAGDIFSFTHPTTGQNHTLLVQEYEQQEVPEHGLEDDMEWPTHYTAMNYTITPDLPDNSFVIQDRSDSDQPRRADERFEPEAQMDTCCSIIGSADGPTAIFMGIPRKERCKYRIACSALHFETVDDVEWSITFREKQFDDMRVEIV